MTARERRIATLAAAAHAKSQAKTKAAEQAIRALVKRGEPITFQAVQREARVSHAFLYGHPDLRSRIERLRAQACPVPLAPTPEETDNTITATLANQITHLKSSTAMKSTPSGQPSNKPTARTSSFAANSPGAAGPRRPIRHALICDGPTAK